MHALVLLLATSLAVVAAETRNQRIVGGEVTTIEQYPYAAALLASSWGGFNQACGGTIINNRAILTAAHCFLTLPSPSSWRVRVGSTLANRDGVVHEVAQLIHHPNFNRQTLDSDITIMRVTTAFTFNNRVRAGSIAGSNYNLLDNQAVTAIGWGTLWFLGPGSNELRHVQIWTVNQNTCRTRYSELRYTITDNMLCSGWLDIGGRDQCQGDSGGPLIHNGVVVGVCSWGEECALARYPGVNVRVSRYTAWIQNNA